MIRSNQLSVGTDAVAPVTGLDTRDPAFREDPHAILDHLRDRCPVYQDRKFDRVVLTRADDVAAALADRSLSSSPCNARPTALTHLGFTEADRAAPPLIFLDGSNHARLRKPLVNALTARAVNNMRPRVEGIVAGLLNAIRADEPFELIGAYASPVPVYVIAALLGIDHADADKFKRLSDDYVLRLAGGLTEEERRRGEAAGRELSQYLGSIVEDRRRIPRDDLISGLLSAQIDGERLSTAEIELLSRGLLVAGNITTTDMMSNGVVALLRNPAQLTRLQAEPSLWPAAIEELLRYDLPGFSLNRFAVGAREIRGCPVEAGQTVTVHLTAANHDPALHVDPHALDIERPRQKHFSFGGGGHFCPGAALARMELQIAMSALFDRFPGLQLVSGRAPNRRRHAMLNGYEAVWLEAHDATMRDC